MGPMLVGGSLLLLVTTVQSIVPTMYNSQGAPMQPATVTVQSSASIAATTKPSSTPAAATPTTGATPPLTASTTPPAAANPGAAGAAAVAASTPAVCTNLASLAPSAPACAPMLKPYAAVQGAANLSYVEFAHGHPPFSMVLSASNFDEISWANTLNEVEYAYHTSIARSVIKNLVGAGETCNIIDIGGNIGYVTMMWASQGCNVQTWEANPFSASLIKQTLATNGDAIQKRVEVKNAAISKTQGELKFAVLGKGSIYDHTATGQEENGVLPGKEWSLVKVPGMPLPPRNGVPVTFVKIDCEGCEPIAIAGLEQTLLDPQVRPKVIQTEWIPERMRDPGPAAMVEMLAKAGYEGRMTNGQLADAKALPTQGFGDLFFVHKSVKDFECLSQAMLQDHIALTKCPTRVPKPCGGGPCQQGAVPTAKPNQLLASQTHSQ